VGEIVAILSTNALRIRALRIAQKSSTHRSVADFAATTRYLPTVSRGFSDRLPAVGALVAGSRRTQRRQTADKAVGKRRFAGRQTAD